MEKIRAIIQFLKDKHLMLTTAESCTAGVIISLLSKVPGSGECLDIGYVVYSENAKKKVLHVKAATIEKYTLTSEEVAEEMARGALKYSQANVVIATTGLAGDEPRDGTAPGTICFAWGFKNKRLKIYKETKVFTGSRSQVQKKAALYALTQIPCYHQK